MIFRRRAALALLTALFALALPAIASAEVIIDSTADEPDAAPGGVCETAAGECTLRAAIQVANAAGTAQDLVFDPTLFNGQLADTVALTSPLPAIKAPVSLIAAGNCPFGSIQKPCAGVSGPAANFGISIESDDVTIASLSITGALIGIDVINESQDFTARGDWIGVKLDGSAGPNNTGIFIDPGSDGATIGGSLPGERNVIAGNNNEGLDIEGASNAVIRGNYFGVAADGTTQMANATNIEISDSTASGGFAAENNEVGRTIEGAPLISGACDGGCNVISGAGVGIELNGFGAGEAPASGPTTVHGNYIGLDAAGSGAIANSVHGIRAGGADQLTVGGLAPTEKNYLAGGGIGIVGENGENLKVLGNTIGIAPDGSDLPAPSETGVFVMASSVSEESSIEGNEIRMGGGAGIDVRFATGRIIGNHLEGGSSGIQTLAEPGGGLIAGNDIESPTDYGILVENPDNEVRANTITDSGGTGIGVTNPPGIAMNGGLIGGSTAEKENVIEGSNGPAIEILEEATDPGSTTEIARNRGSDNGGLFIDLVGNANEGIQPPAFATSTQSTASGSGAVANAKIRVFANATKSPGQIGGFLAETVADGKGNWKVTYPSIATGTAIGATQTNPAGGTSELSYATATADPSQDKGKEPDVIVDPVCAFTAGKCRWPETVITGAPKGKTHATTIKFRFSSDMPGSTFECKLDKKPFKKCKSPKKYKGLKPGEHVFKVRATDTKGTVDPVPAKKKFRVLPAS